MLFLTPGPLPDSKNVGWNLGRPLTPPLYRWGHRGLELWSHFPKPFKPVSCKARNKNHILCLWGSTLSLLEPYLWVESFQSSSSCFSPLLNNMLEHPKADSIWEALVTAGYKHQRSQSKSFQHSLLCPWSVSQEHMPSHGLLSSMCCITDKPEENRSHVSRDYNNNLLRYHKTKDAGVTEFQTEGRHTELVSICYCIYSVHTATRWTLCHQRESVFPILPIFIFCSQQPYEVHRAGL